MPDNLKAAAAKGVDTDTGAPEGVPTGYESFAINEDTFNDFIQKSLFKQLGSSAVLRKGPESGQREYFNPATKRWTLLTHSSAGQQAIAHSGDALNLIGSLAGALAAKNPTVLGELAAVSTKTAGGTGITDYARQKIGDWLGVNETNDSDRTINAIKHGTKEGAIAAGFGTVFNAGRYIKMAIKGRPTFTDQEAQELLSGMGKYRDLVDEINRGSDVEFKPPIHHFVDPNLPAAQIAENRWEALGRSSDEDIRYKVAQARSNEFGAIRSYFLKMNAPNQAPGIPMTAEGRAQAGTGAAQAIQEQMEARMAPVNAAAAQAEASGRQIASTLPQGVSGTMQDAGQVARDQLWAQSQASAQHVDDAYRKFNDFINYNARTGTSPYTVEIPLRGDLATIIDKFGRDTVTKELKGGLPTLTGKGTVKIDVATLDQAAKNINGAVRDRTTGGANVDYSDVDLIAARKKILNTLSDYLRKGSMDGTLPEETFRTWVEAQAAAKADARLFQRGFLKKFLEKDEAGQWVINDQDALSGILQGKDNAAASQLYGMVNQDPVAMREIKKVLFSLYEKHALLNGLPSTKLHNEFMASDNYGPIMDRFFKNEDFNKLNSFKDVADSLLKTAEDAKIMQARLIKDFGGKITRWNPEDLVQNVLSKSLKSSEVAKLYTIASKKPGALDDLKNGIANEVQMRLFPRGVEGGIDLGALGTIVDKYGNNIRVLMGPEYLNSLNTLKRTIPMLERNPAKFGDPPVMTRLQSALRVPAGVMSPEGRLMTFLGVLRGRNNPAQVWEALTDPAELEKLANRTRIAVERTRIAGVAGAVVGEEYRND